MAATPIAGLVLEIEAVKHGATGAGREHGTGADLEHTATAGAGERRPRRQRAEERQRGQ